MPRKSVKVNTGEHDRALEVSRAIKSRQPRMGKSTPADATFSSVIDWFVSVELQEVPYGKLDNRVRDKWLNTIWMKEPHLAGVLNGAVLIDANRGWTLTGGRNQVNRYLDMMHNLEGGKGYNWFQRKMALAFRTSDLGAIAEIGREGGPAGPMRMLWSMDPSKCRLTGNEPLSLKYKPAKGNEQAWITKDYMRMTSMLSTREELYDLGFCGVSRAIEWTKLAIGILQHDQEKVRARAPEGILLLKGIQQGQWDKAMEDRKAKMTQLERQYFGSVFVLAGLQEIAANLLMLSEMPEGLDRRSWVEMLMYGYSLIFGYSPDEFWPVNFGALGRGEESGIQHRKATAKGGQDYIKLFQETFQRELPDTLLYEYDERDVTGETEDAILRQQQVKWVIDLHKEGLVNTAQGQVLLAEMGVIDESWTPTEEDVSATEEEPAVDEEPKLEEEAPELEPEPETPPVPEEERQLKWRSLVRREQVQRAAWQFPNEPIIQAHWRGGKVDIETVVTRGEKLLPGTFYSVPVKRQVGDEVLYQDSDVVITQGDVTRAIQVGRKRVGNDFADLLTAEVTQ